MKDCKQCENSITNWLGDVGCKILKDWITHQEYKNGKIKLDSCPKEHK